MNIKYLYELVHLLNTYSGDSEQKNKIRDLICFISDDEDCMKENIYRNVIFEAAQKLRMFGYIKGSKQIKIDEFSSNDLFDIKHQAIQNYYRSKVFSNNLLDKYQKEIIDKFNSLDIKRILVSAPTSFGKTFLLREILFTNKERYNNILLVFPTIALLNENTDSIHKMIDSLNADYIIVNNVYTNIDITKKHIFILTPERTLKLLSDNKDLYLDFFFFDEIYKIDEKFDDNKMSSDNRAKAFRITLYLLSKIVPEFYLAGPYLNLKECGKGLKTYIQKLNITKIEVNLEPTLRVEIDAWKKNSLSYHPVLGEEKIHIYDYEDHKKLNKIDKITSIINYVQNNNWGQSILYCSVPSKTIEYTNQLTKTMKNTISAKFISHLKKRYGVSMYNGSNSSSYWGLVSALENGYGIHHGKFPKYIQKEILKMFNNNDFEFLFCTSTIIEGVNTNAKNVIIINNSVGNAEMSAFALKNIKGRAGRYYHNSIGRIFYTDKKQRELEKNNIVLNFPTFDENRLLDEDIDNTDFNDLYETNKITKLQREKSFDKNILPDDVFIKNRLFPRDIQEKYLLYLCNDKIFNIFYPLIGKTNNIKFFLKEKYIQKILNTMGDCNLIDEKKSIVYKSVVSNYSFQGTVGIIKYKIKEKTQNGKDISTKNINSAYIAAFDQIRNIIEYEIPKLLCLFESLYQQAGTIKGFNMSDFKLSLVIRFFELGISSEFGLFLVEYGFPIDTIQKIEKKLYKIKNLSTTESISYLRKNYRVVLELLDEYELELFKKAIQILEKRNL